MDTLDYMYRLVVGNFQNISFLVLIFILFKDRDQLKIMWDKIAYFIGFMVVLSLVRLCVMDQAIPQGFNRLSLSTFLWVGLEDVFFVMIPIYIARFCKTKFLKFAVWAFSTVLFASGHIYQGLTAVAITALYPYFISRKYILKTSLATVMICHFVYDCFTFLTVKANKVLHLLHYF